MRKAEKYKGAVAVAAIAYTWSQTAKTLRETQAITIPSDLPKGTPATPTSSQVDVPNHQLPNSSDLISIARSFPYTKDPIGKTKDPTGTNSDLEDPCTQDIDISRGDFDPGLFHSNPNFFDPDVAPNYLPEGFIEKSIEVSELGRLLLQVGLGGS